MLCPLTLAHGGSCSRVYVLSLMSHSRRPLSAQSGLKKCTLGRWRFCHCFCLISQGHHRPRTKVLCSLLLPDVKQCKFKASVQAELRVIMKYIFPMQSRVKDRQLSLSFPFAVNGLYLANWLLQCVALKGLCFQQEVSVLTLQLMDLRLSLLFLKDIQTQTP